MSSIFISAADSYDSICEKWDEFRKKTVLNTCIDDLSRLIKSGGRILDVGCGTGYPIAAALCRRGFLVTGIDVSQKMLEKARSLSLENATFLNKDLLDYKTNSLFNAIIAFDSLWHIPHERQREIYPLLSSLLLPGGVLLFTHGKQNGEMTGEMYGERFYYSALDSNEVNNLLCKNGFKILLFTENYEEKTTGTRDLLIVAQKMPAAL